MPARAFGVFMRKNGGVIYGTIEDTADGGDDLEENDFLRIPAISGESVSAALQYGGFPDCREFPREQRARGSQLVRQSGQAL